MVIGIFPSLTPTDNRSRPGETAGATKEQSCNLCPDPWQFDVDRVCLIHATNLWKGSVHL